MEIDRREAVLLRCGRFPAHGATMIRRSTPVLLLAIALLASLADTAFARYHRRGRRGGFGGTAASAAMMGYAQLLRAQGMQNLQNSQAAINWEKAKTLEIQNRELWTDTYFHMRQVNHAMQAAEHGPRVTSAEAEKLAHDALPHRLTVSELASETGRIDYPEVLRDPRYDAFRGDVDDFFARRAATHGSMSFTDLQHVATILELWHAELANHIDAYAAGPYGHAVSFLERLDVEAHLSPR